MRQLMVRQKKVLDKFIAKCKLSKENEYIYNAVYKIPGGTYVNYLGAEDLPNEVWEELVRINDTEILWQEVDRYLHDARWGK